MSYEKIPQELKQLKQWGLFRTEWSEERQKFNKFPVDAHNGHLAKSNDENTWVTFAEAIQAKDKYQNIVGLAFFFKEPYIGIDIDHIQEAIQNMIQGDNSDDNIAYDFINHTQSYTETSISGTGLHIIIKGKMPGSKRRKANVEIYPNGRFFALTGNIFDQEYDHINKVNDNDLNYLYHKYIDNEPQTTTPNIPEFTEGTKILMNSAEVIKKAIASPSGSIFKKLLQGNWQGAGYNSQSEADLAFADMLAFWTAKNVALMDQIVRESGLYRHKWDEKHGATTYGQMTLNKAINDTRNVYSQNEHDNFHIEIKDHSKTHKGIVIPKALRNMSYTDEGLRNRFLKKYYGVVKFSAQRKKFMYFKNGKWNYDEDGTVMRWLDNVVPKIEHEPLKIQDDEDEEDAKTNRTKFLKRCRSTNGKRNAMKQVEDFVKISDEEFDTQVGVINTPSGVVDLSSGEIKATTYKDLMTKSTNAEVLNEETPYYDQFMHDIFPGHPELISFVERLMGYTLLGTTAEQVAVFLVGHGKHNGSNGKSTLVDLYREIAGDYATTVTPDIITANNKFGNDSSSMNQLANTKGARMIVTSELERGAILSEAMLKRISGNEQITARRLYETPFSFVPTGTLWMTSNYVPTVKDTDDGIWRRLIFIPMSAHITHPDKNLKNKLLTEKAGILNKIINAALKYQKQQDLAVPQICKDVVDDYRDDMDTVGQFVKETMVADEDAKIMNDELAFAFNKWNKENETPLTLNALRRELAQRYNKFRTTSKRGYQGIRPKKEYKMFKVNIINHN